MSNESVTGTLKMISFKSGRLIRVIPQILCFFNKSHHYIQVLSIFKPVNKIKHILNDYEKKIFDIRDDKTSTYYYMSLHKHYPLILLCGIILVSGCSEIRQQPVTDFVMNNPAEAGTKFPNLYKDESGTIHMSWLLGIEEDISALRYSSYKNNRWTEVKTVRVADDFFVNWADFPSVAGYDGNVTAAHWLREFEYEVVATHIQIGFPGEDGRWRSSVTPHEDRSMTEHGFVTMLPLSENKVLTIWLDGRNTEGRAHDEYGDTSKGMTLRSAEILKGGVVERRNEIDQLVCDCCQTDLTAVDGGALAVYRNRTEDEIRDIAISRYDSESGRWGEPKIVAEDGWQINGCPVNGPRIVNVDEQVAVTWYTAANENPRVQLARSTDDGESFQEPIVIADENTIGRPDLILREDGSIYVSYIVRAENLGYIMLRKVNPDGSVTDPLNVGITTSARSSGFPRIVEMEKGVLFAWTQTDPVFKVRTALVPFDLW